MPCCISALVEYKGFGRPGGKRPIRFKCVSLGGDEDKTAGGVLKHPKYLIKGLMMLNEVSE